MVGFPHITFSFSRSRSCLLQVTGSRLFLTQCCPLIRLAPVITSEEKVPCQNESSQSPSCSINYCNVSCCLISDHFLLTILYRSAKDEVARKLRWFYVSTSATATTLQTAEMPAFVDRLKTTTFEIVPHF